MSCRCQRRRPLDHYLVAGDWNDIEAMRAFLALLPATAYGQVIVAGSPATATSPATHLVAPPRMIVTHVGATHHSEAGVASAVATRGAVLADAVTAWLAEWVPEEPTAERIVSMWIGGRGSAAVDALCERLPEFQRL